MLDISAGIPSTGYGIGDSGLFFMSNCVWAVYFSSYVYSFKSSLMGSKTTSQGALFAFSTLSALYHVVETCPPSPLCSYENHRHITAGKNSSNLLCAETDRSKILT